MPYDPRITPEVRAKAREAVRKAWVSPWPHDDHRSFDDVIIARADQFIDAILAEVVGPERVIVERRSQALLGGLLEAIRDGDIGKVRRARLEWLYAEDHPISASQEGNDGDSLARSLKETG